MTAEDYARKLRFEQQHFQNQEDVHALPEIFHYWSNRHILPMLQTCGFVNDEDLYTQYLRRAADACGRGVPRFISIGAGNGDLEVRVAQRLRKSGLSDFVFECLETTPAMLERGRELARQAKLHDHVLMVEGDFNHWDAQHEYTGVIANQALHHVVELERLFDEIKRALHPRGYFVTNDMVGRNGHMRWPEALEAMRPFWLELPSEYRWNRLYRRHEEEYINHDCSKEGFEGIRAQDILPLLTERFDFSVFAAFGNIVNVFVDRVFGHNFDASQAWDRDFIDRVHAADEARIHSGTLSPTQMFAVMTVGEVTERQFARGLSPQHCIRRQPRVAGFQDDLRMETTSLQPIGGWGVQFSQQLKAMGGLPPYHYHAETLAPGLALSEAGMLSGRITSLGRFSTVIQVRDSATPPRQVQQAYTLLVRDDDLVPPLTLPARITLAAAVRNQEYRQPLGAIGGLPPLEWNLDAGKLPRGLALDGDQAIITGTPARDGVFGFRVRVKDKRGSVAKAPVLLQVLRSADTSWLVLPQMAAGGRWRTELCLTNAGPYAARIALRFRDSMGSKWTVPVAVTRGDDEPENRHFHECEETLAPYSCLRLRTLRGTEGDRAGWAEVECSGAVRGYAELHSDDLYSAIVPMDKAGPASVLLPFDNRHNQRTALAVVALPGGKGNPVSATLWDSTWRSIGSVVLDLKPGEHTSFRLDERFPQVRSMEGLVEMESPGGRVAALALQFSPDGPFRHLPALPPRHV